MRRWMPGFNTVAALTLAYWAIGTGLAVFFVWPSYVTADVYGAGKPANMLQESVTAGTALSPPLVPNVALFAVFTLLGLSRRWWGTAALVGAWLVAIPVLVLQVAQGFSPPASDVPPALPIAGAAVSAVLVVGLLTSGIVELRDRVGRSVQATALLAGAGLGGILGFLAAMGVTIAAGAIAQPAYPDQLLGVTALSVVLLVPTGVTLGLMVARRIARGATRDRHQGRLGSEQ